MWTRDKVGNTTHDKTQCQEEEDERSDERQEEQWFRKVRRLSRMFVHVCMYEEREAGQGRAGQGRERKVRLRAPGRKKGRGTMPCELCTFLISRHGWGARYTARHVRSCGVLVHQKGSQGDEGVARGIKDMVQNGHPVFPGGEGRLPEKGLPAWHYCDWNACSGWVNKPQVVVVFGAEHLQALPARLPRPKTSLE